MRLFTLFPNLITKESYNWWVTRRFWGFRQQISKAKYLKISPNVSGTYREASGEHRDTIQKWLQNSSGKRYQMIRICPTGEVETPSFPIRRPEMSKCKISGWNVQDVRHPGVMAAQQLHPNVRHPGGMLSE